jgi:hypothetical protein
MEAANSSATSLLTYQCGSLFNQQKKVYLSLRFNFTSELKANMDPEFVTAEIQFGQPVISSMLCVICV